MRSKFFNDEEGIYESYNYDVDTIIFFAKELNYTKSDIEYLTTRELNSIVKSNFLKFYNDKLYYEDMSKFARLGQWVLNGLGADINDIEDLIGEYPKLNNIKEVVRELTEDEKMWVEFAKASGKKYTITDEGIRLG